ncbi:MAG: hypothetical protein IJZ89_04800 [Clostridia bacterium]|nr:hypothetical protein [Clostridia bacterium]
MLTNRLLSAETTVAEEGFGSAIKNFFTELLYGGSDMQYENFSFGNQVVTYRMIILAVVFGLILASAVMIYKRKVLGKMVRELAKQGATDPERAKTLSSLGLSGSKMIVYSLKNGTLKRMLGCVERDGHNEKMRELIENSTNEKTKKKPVISDYIPHPETDRYYIHEDRVKDMVDLFSEKGSGIGGFTITVIFCIIAAAILFTLVPWFITLIDKTM